MLTLTAGKNNQQKDGKDEHKANFPTGEGDFQDRL